MLTRLNWVRFGFAGLLGCALALGCTRKQAAYFTDTGDERIVETAAETHSKLEKAVVDESTVDEYLSEVGRRIIDAAKELDAQAYMRESDWQPADTAWMFADDIQFHLVNNDKVNAVTTGGKHMYIYNGFLQQCRSEDELAAVMAHEFAHIYLQHIGEKVGAQKSQEMVGALLGAVLNETVVKDEDPMLQQATSDATMQITKNVGSEILLGHSPGDEDQADAAGLAFFARAGYDPNKFADVFQLALDKSGGTASAPGKKSEHPALETRIANAKRRAAKLLEDTPDAKDWRRKPVASLLKFRQVKEQASKAVASMPEGTEMLQAKEVLGAFSSCFTDEDDNRREEAEKAAARQKQAQPAQPQKQPQKPLENPLNKLFGR